MKPRYFLARGERADRLIQIIMPGSGNPEVREYSSSESTVDLGGVIGKRVNKPCWQLFKGHVESKDMKEINTNQLQFYQAIMTWPCRHPAYVGQGPITNRQLQGWGPPIIYSGRLK